jgi:hypothetical protein
MPVYTWYTQLNGVARLNITGVDRRGKENKSTWMEGKQKAINGKTTETTRGNR